MSTKELSSRSKKSARTAVARSVPARPKKIGQRLDGKMAAEKSKNMPRSEKSIAAAQNINILTLNDDCFLEILPLLTLKDLRALKDCCQRFKYLVDSVVQKRFQKDEYFKISYRNGFKDAAMTLIKFGQFITQLHIGDTDEFIKFCDRQVDGWSFGSVMENCISLKSLKLHHIYTQKIPFVELKKMFANIETLELKYFDLDRVLYEAENKQKILFAILKAAKKLRHLTIHSYDRFYNFLSLMSECVDMESVHIHLEPAGYIMEESDVLNYLKMLQSLKKLKRLEISYMFSTIYSYVSYLGDIGRQLNTFTSLESFTLYSNQDVSGEIKETATNFDVTVKKPNGCIHSYVITLNRRN